MRFYIGTISIGRKAEKFFFLFLYTRPLYVLLRSTPQVQSHDKIHFHPISFLNVRSDSFISHKKTEEKDTKRIFYCVSLCVVNSR